MALKKQIKETKAAEVKAAAETKEEVKTAVKAAEDKVSEKVEEVKQALQPIIDELHINQSERGAGFEASGTRNVAVLMTAAKSACMISASWA